MRQEVYKRHIKNYSEHWWFQARKKIIQSIIKKKIRKKSIKILDFGSGSGVNINMLSTFGQVSIYEPNKSAKSFLREKYKGKKFKIINNFKNKKYDLIVLADVLEHIKDDHATVRKLNKILNNKGFILITVPAYKVLFSQKDKILKHFRRYSKNEIQKVFNKFNLIKLTYFNFFLFLPISTIIILMKIFNINFIDKVEKLPVKIINHILYFIFVSESRLINLFNLPFGLSMLGLFQKK